MRARPRHRSISPSPADPSVSEITINGFEGENKEVRTEDPDKIGTEHQDGWLITGQYSSEGGNKRGVLTRG